MRTTINFLVPLLLLFSFISCDILEDDECDKTDKPEIVFDVDLSGSVYAVGYLTVPEATVLVEIYKLHCRGEKSSTFSYACAFEKGEFLGDPYLVCGIGSTVRFTMNNEDDVLFFSFKYSKNYPPQYGSPFAQRTLKYAPLRDCPVYPRTGVAYITFNIDFDEFWENPSLTRFEVLCR